MSNDRRQILEILAAGKITADEAERLLKALEDGPKASAPAAAPAPESARKALNAKYLRVVVEDNGKEDGDGPTKVNIRVPMQLLRAGVKLTGLLPKQARQQIDERLKESGAGFDLSQVKPENLEELIENLSELTVDVDDRNAKIRIFCE